MADPVPGGEGGALSVAGAPSAGGAGGSPQLPTIDCEPITFQDANLEQAVRLALDQPTGPIVSADVEDLTSLLASGFGVASLSGIECLSSLTVLELGMGGAPSNISNLEPLRYLKQLASLDLTSNPLDDLSPLAELTLLDNLTLNYALDASDDLSPLAQLPNLAALSMPNNDLGDLSPIGQIESLVILDLDSATLTAPNSISTLSNVTNLQVSNVLSDATPLGALTQLQHLYADGKPLANVAELAPLVNLRVLDLNYTDITTLAFTANMTELVQLRATFNAVTDITPLQGLSKLNLLYLNFNPIADITPLVNNAGIGSGDTVNLAGTSITCPSAAVTTLRGRGATVNAPTACN
jgi:internalin A